MSTTRTNSMKFLLSAYFHEDWDLDGGDPALMLEKFLASYADSDTALNAADEIDQYLALGYSNEKIEVDLLYEFGCYYSPSSDGIPAREWLYFTAETIRQRK